MCEKELEVMITKKMYELLSRGIVECDGLGNVDIGELVEVTAEDLGHAEWIDEDCHPIWECAYVVACEYTFGEAG